MEERAKGGTSELILRFQRVNNPILGLDAVPWGEGPPRPSIMFPTLAAQDAASDFRLACHSATRAVTQGP